MGAKASSEFGQIHVNFDKPSYFQGEYVYGSVYLNLLKDFPGNELFIKFKGKEEARWSEGSGKNKSHYHGKKIVLSHQFPLYKFNGQFTPMGQYHFPFSVYIPPGLPASFKYSGGIQCSTTYKIKAEIKINDKNYKHFRSSKELTLKQAKNEDYAPLDNQLRVNVDICCCCGQGFTNIATKVNKTFFFEGEKASIQCSVDNSQCDLPLTTIEMHLQNVLLVKSNYGHIHTVTWNLVSQNQRVNLPARSVSPCQLNFDLTIKNNKAEKLKTSCQGEHVRNDYFLTIYPRYESFLCNCCVKSVCTPILIYEPKDEDLQQQQVKAPENWSPQVMPAQNFDWKMAQMYQGKNAGGYDYPQVDPNQMFQQYVPPPPNYPEWYGQQQQGLSGGNYMNQGAPAQNYQYGNQQPPPGNFGNDYPLQEPLNPTGVYPNQEYAKQF